MRWKALRSFNGSPSPSQSFCADDFGVSGFSSTTPAPPLPMIEAKRSSFTPGLLRMRSSVIGRMITSGSKAGSVPPARAARGAEVASTARPPSASDAETRSAEIGAASRSLLRHVGAAGFEPATSCSQSKCATRLRYAPAGDQCR